MNTTYIINTFDDFHKYFKHLKEDAMMGINQKIYVIGLDTEFICKDNYPDSFEQSKSWIVDTTSSKMAMCTIQIASPHVCMVINLTKMGKPLPKKLIALLTSDSWVKFGIGIENDLRILSLNYQLGHCSGSIELKSLAIMVGHPKPNLEFLYNQFVGGHVKKTSSVHDWTKELTDEQISYAARDAIMSYQVGMSMINPTLLHIKKIVETDISNKLQIKIMNGDSNENDSNERVSNENVSKSPFPEKIKKSEATTVNYVGRLNEIAQRNKIPLPTYEFVCDESTHPKKFTSICTFGEHILGAGGLSKRDAKSLAAKDMLDVIN